MLKYFLIGVGVLFAVVVISYMMLKKKLDTSEVRQIQRLREGTKEKSFSSEVIYQKLYIFYLKIPFLKKYLLKIRRRLEIINIDDEYLTRKQASKILTNTLLIMTPVTLAIIALTKNNYLVLIFLLIFEVFMIDTFIGGMVDKLDNKLLKELRLNKIPDDCNECEHSETCHGGLKCLTYALYKDLNHKDYGCNY